MGDAHTAELDPLDILKAKIRKAVKESGISSDVAEVQIIEPPELKGEHFATETVYAKIRFTEPSIKDKNLFVKKFSSSPVHTEMVKQMKVMDKEAAFFKEFLPLARKFCKKFPGGEDLLHFFPKCFYADDECVIMENLVLDSNYVMLDKEEQQDLYTAKVVTTNLAKFHAATYAFIEDMGRDVFRKKFAMSITESFDCSENSAMAPMFDSSIVTNMKILTDNPVPGSSAATAELGALLGKMIPQLAELLNENDDSQPFLVLNHGDCWNNNMLFRKDPKTGLVSDHIFVDLQITRYGSPCLDLGYYFFTSIKPEVRRAEYLYLLKIYYDQFVETTELMGSKCPVTFEELVVDFKKFVKLGYFMAITMLPAMGAMKEIDMNDMGTDQAVMMEKFNGIIANWIQQNPVKATEIAQNIVGFIQDFDDLQRK